MKEAAEHLKMEDKYIILRMLETPYQYLYNFKHYTMELTKWIITF